MTDQEIKDLAEQLRVENDLWLLPEAWYDWRAEYESQVKEVISDMELHLNTFDPDLLENVLYALAENCLAHHLATAETLHDES